MTSFRLSRTKASLLLILALTSLVYAGSLKNGFVLDDAVLIVQNDFIKSWGNFPKIFGNEYLTAISNWSDHQKLSGSGEVTYRPLVTMTYFLDYYFWKLNPFGHHLTNLGLHLLSVLLMFFLARAISKNSSVALLASLLFALHPVNSEAVLVITNRKDMMAFLFYASAFLFFLKKDVENSARKGALLSYLSLFCFFLALFTKEMAMTLPAMLMLYDLFFVFRGDWAALRGQALKRYGAYFLVLFAYGVFWFLLRGGVGDFHKATPHSGGRHSTTHFPLTRGVTVFLQ
jgi:protein O-mannosyl-transferase